MFELVEKPAADCSVEKPSDWFFTFGQGHSTADGASLARKYFVVTGATYDEARAQIIGLRGGEWSFQYPISDLSDQRERFHLSPVTAEQLKGIRR